MTVVEVEASLADMFRVTAVLIRLEHQVGCPDFAVWREMATLLDAAADDAVSGPDVERAVSIASGYLSADRPAEVPA